MCSLCFLTPKDNDDKKQAAVWKPVEEKHEIFKDISETKTVE